MRISKSVSLTRQRAVTAFLEGYNLTNHINYLTYQSNVTVATFGQPLSAGPTRQLQLGARFDF
jgi:hypothetical protein